MDDATRRALLAATATGGIAAATAAVAQTVRHEEAIN